MHRPIGPLFIHWRVKLAPNIVLNIKKVQNKSFSGAILTPPVNMSNYIIIASVSIVLSRLISMVSHPRQKSTFYFQHHYIFSTQLFVFNTTFYFQNNFLFSTQLFIFNTTFYSQHNFLFSTQLFLSNRNPLMSCIAGSHFFRKKL